MRPQLSAYAGQSQTVACFGISRYGSRAQAGWSDSRSDLEDCLCASHGFAIWFNVENWALALLCKSEIAGARGEARTKAGCERRTIGGHVYAIPSSIRSYMGTFGCISNILPGLHHSKPPTSRKVSLIHRSPPGDSKPRARTGPSDWFLDPSSARLVLRLKPVLGGATNLERQADNVW